MPIITDILAAHPHKQSGAYYRARVVAYTGIPPAMLMKVKPRDLLPLPDAPTHIRLAERTKGEHVEERTLPLSAEAIAAFVAFHRANMYGAFTVDTVNQSVKAAARRVGIDPTTICLYHFRHSFLCHMYRVTRDLATVARFAMHAEGSPLTAMYAAGANDDVNADAITAFDRSLVPPPTPAPMVPVQVPAVQLPATVASNRKFRVIKGLRHASGL